jgi:hypothetical protein
VKFPLFLLYPLYTSVIALVMLAVVPRESIRRLVPFALLFGAVFDGIWLLLLGGVLGIARYINFSPFGVLGIPFFPPLAWTFFFVLYLYLLPDKSPWNYGFSVTSAIYATMFSNVLQNLQLFEWRGNRLLLPLAVYLIWMLAVTLIYQKYFKETKIHS